MSDPYKTLGVARDATLDQITRAWREAASVHHPDKGGDVEKFRAARAAFELLTDPARREEWDARLSGNTLATGLVTQDDYEMLMAARAGANLSTVIGTATRCLICGGSKEVRVVQSGFWLRKACPACS